MHLKLNLISENIKKVRKSAELGKVFPGAKECSISEIPIHNFLEFSNSITNNKILEI